EGDRSSAIAAKHAARTGRRSIDFRHLSGKGKGLVGNTEPCSERGRGVAAAAFAVAMRAPVLRPGEFERHGTAKTLSPLRHHPTSIHAPVKQHGSKGISQFEILRPAALIKGARKRRTQSLQATRSSVRPAHGS